MTDTENWRRQRAIELGLESCMNSTQQQASSLADHIVFSAQYSITADRGGKDIGDSVVAMRSPSPDRSAFVDIDKPRELSVQLSPQPFSLPQARQQTAADERVGAQRDPLNMAGVVPRPGRGVSVYLAGAILAVAAVGGARFARPQIHLIPSPAAPLQAIKYEPAVTLAALPPVAVAAADAQPVLPAVAAVACDEPEIVAGLRTAATDQLRKSSLNARKYPLVTVAGVTSARSKVADTGGGLTVCTAALSLRRATGKTATFDVDYAIQTVAGSRPRVVPLGFNQLADSVAASAPIDLEDAAPKRAALRPSETANKPSRDTAVRSRIVVVAKPVLVSKGPLANTAPTSVGLPSITGLSLATRESDARPEVVKMSRGCGQPATLSLSITCRNASLLALNAEITSAIVALDKPDNARILARIKRRADVRFDQCETVTCVGNAYRYWRNALARVMPDQNATVSAGRHDSETRSSTAYREDNVPRLQRNWP